MTTQQLKEAVVKALDEVPEEVLSELLEYLESLKGKDELSIQRARQLSVILKEDSALLKALAQ